MDRSELKKRWEAEEAKVFQGWDFSELDGRLEEEELPWDYRTLVQQEMSENAVMLDMGTGGGEFLLSLSPPPGRTYATEAYPPNYELCLAKLPAYGIEVSKVEEDDQLPYEDEFFNLVLNRHESFSAKEVYRILKPGGVFITQQVGGRNNRELSRNLLGEGAMKTPAEFDLAHTVRDMIEAGFDVEVQQEAFPEVKFRDVGALVYFAKILEWEFADFSVERCFEKLCELQNIIDQTGFVSSREHRFLILARKER
ncbi:methyltransferase [Paenibacillus sp. J53TS2]|uniref:class I SAM-dependent methyltransferase n=1 Tax=Paenibacillus sp. J53TS2 TaxID=2807197 RepID=UPI001B22492B|nr:class I SAM-dependent methyltransferase [Paenibacillus sp. J53TS2]GIP49965.1 methyltransferase [Paenibacillus sp. J53TS2]